MELIKKQHIKYCNTSTNLPSSEINQSFFPSLTHKELLSIHDLKLKTNSNLRANVNKNFHRNFHPEIMKINLKENSKYSTLYKDSTTYTKTETKLPSLKNGKDKKMFKLYMEPNTISSIINKSVNKKNKINYKTIFNNINSRKFNISNISTSENIPPSIKSFKLSAFDKLKSNSDDVTGSLLNLETQKSNTYNNSSISNKNNLKYNNTETINTFSYDIKNEFNKKFVSSLNPLYSSLKNELISEFYKKTKDINYLRFILMKNKKDIEIEEERRCSKMERLNQIYYSIQTLQKLFNKYFLAKYDYLNYLKKEITKETEKNETLKEEKITLMKEIYTIRHKTLRLENRFRLYLNDKFFLLSVKNHSFKLDKFDPEDKADYIKDMEKLDILNFMLKITSKEYNDSDIEKDKIRATKIFKKADLLVLYNTNSNNNNTNTINSLSRNNTLRNTHRQNTNSKNYSSKNNINNKNSPILDLSKKRILKRNFEAKPIYEDVYYFNKDLQETTQKIQKSLDEYNNNIKELNMNKQYLFKSKKEMKDIRDYEQHMKDEIILFRKKLENLKKLNNGLFNYRKYLKNIFILNLNKGKVFEKIKLILNNIEQSEDIDLLNFISKVFNDYNTYLITGLDKLKLIEGVFQYLIDYKKAQKKSKNEDYLLLQAEIDDINRKKICQRKQDSIKKKFDTLIQKVIDKNKKIIFIPRKHVNFDMRQYLHKNKTENKTKNDFYLFDEFDFV